MGALALVVVANLVIALSTKETYRTCNADKDVCISRSESLRVPGFGKSDRVRVSSGPNGECGADEPTPFEFGDKQFRATFHANTIEVRGEFAGDRVVYGFPVC